MATLRRTHTCGELRASHVGQTVILSGWVNSHRGHKWQMFVDLRDRYGLTQFVFDAEENKALFEQGQSLRSEFVVAMKGTVVARAADQRNPKMATGDIEVRVAEVQVLNQCPA